MLTDGSGQATEYDDNNNPCDRVIPLVKASQVILVLPLPDTELLFSSFESQRRNYATRRAVVRGVEMQLKVSQSIGRSGRSNSFPHS